MVIIGANKVILVMLILFLPESRLWLETNENEAGKTVLERIQNIRIKPYQGFHRVSVTVNKFFTKSASNKSLPGIGTEEETSISSAEMPPRMSILTRARRNSGTFSD